MIDLSHNQLNDLSSEKEFFRLPENITEIYLSNNQLSDLYWNNFKNVSNLSALDLSYNNFERFGPALTAMVVKGTNVYFEGKQMIM